MNTSESSHRHNTGLDPRLPPTRLPFHGAPPAGGWSTLPVAKGLIRALERLIDLNEETARITALYRANLQQQQSAKLRRADAQPTRDDYRRVGSMQDGREGGRSTLMQTVGSLAPPHT